MDNLENIWQNTLSLLQSQTTRALFDTWIRRTRAMSFDGCVFSVSVDNASAKEWLDSRLYDLILRTLRGVDGSVERVEFVVAANAEADDDVEDDGGGHSAPQPVPRRFVTPDFNTEVAGWFKITRYETLFWAPLLGRVAWRVREICLEADLRRDKSDNWTPPRRYTAPSLADLVPCGKQAVTGVARRNGDGNLHHHPGAFDRLVDMGLARVQKQGQPPHVIYIVSVMVRLPMMRPEQVGELPDRLQVKHDRWLEEHGFDSREWFANDEDGAS